MQMVMVMMMMHAHVELIMIIHIMVVVMMMMMMLIMMTIIRATTYMTHTVLLWQSLAFILTTIIIISSSSGSHVLFMMIGIHIACTIVTAFIRVMVACIKQFMILSILMIMNNR